jgi:hypothetical protein
VQSGDHGRARATAGPDTTPLSVETSAAAKTGNKDRTVHRQQRDYPAGQSGEHVVYVTYGTPRQPANDTGGYYKPTIKRMERAVAAAGAADSLDPHVIAQVVMDAQAPKFDLRASPDNAWLVPDTNGDCQSIVRYGIHVLSMVGVPGTYERKNIYAVKDDPENPLEGDNETGLGVPTFRFGHRTQKTWFQGLADGKQRFNAYPRFTAAVYQAAKMLVRSGRPAEALPIVDGSFARSRTRLEIGLCM